MSNKLRSKKTADEYKHYRIEHADDTSCGLCTKEPIKQFTHWKIIDNKFPYDLVADTHHMIVPIRHVAEYEITPDEWLEYKTIKQTTLQEYDYMIEATNKLKSIPEHFHIHLLITKDLSLS